MPYAKTKNGKEKRIDQFVNQNDEIVLPKVVEKKNRKPKSKKKKASGKDEPGLDENDVYDVNDLEIVEQVYKKKISYKQRVRLVKNKLSTGKCGFANKHKDRVTFKTYIERDTKDVKIAKSTLKKNKSNEIEVNEYIAKEYQKIYNKNSTNQDVDNILILFTANLGIPTYLADRAKYILAKTWNYKGQKQNYNKMLYEIAVLGILKFCCNDLELDINY
jgi:hypothetical protein